MQISNLKTDIIFSGQIPPEVLNECFQDPESYNIHTSEKINMSCLKTDDIHGLFNLLQLWDDDKNTIHKMVHRARNQDDKIIQMMANGDDDISQMIEVIAVYLKMHRQE